MIPVCEPYLNGREKEYVNEALKDNWISSGGKYLDQFEQKFAEYCGCKFGVAVTSGTTALHLALATLGIQENDEVIMPTFTIASCAFAVRYLNATPVFVDSEPYTYNIDTYKIEAKITEHTKAIMPVHIYGKPAEMDKILKLALKYNLFVVEDAAEAHGAEYRGKRVGGLGHIGCFSFYSNKLITCLTGDTRVVTILNKKGRGGSRSKLIKDIKIGDRVVSYNEITGVKIEDKVVQIFKRNVESTYNVKLSNSNELDITGNHPVYVVGKGWIEVNNLHVGDELIQYKYFGLENRIREKQNIGKRRIDIIGADQYKNWTEAHSRKISEAHRNPNSGYAKMDKQLKDKHISDAQKRFYQTPKGKIISKRASKRLKDLYANPKSIVNTPMHKYMKSLKMKEVASRPELRENRRLKSIANWENPAYREKVTKIVNEKRVTPEYIQKYIKGLNKKPNKAEKRLNEIISSVCPDYKFNGGYELGITIGNYIPDFVNVNGKKKVIELFGKRWHQESEIESRKAKMAKLGWDCLVIWDSELENQHLRDEVANKIKTFNYNPNVELVKVVEIREVQKPVDVYNIETEINHNYYANGILVHNCGEGGMLVTNCPEYAYKARKLKNLAHTEVRFFHDHIAFNYRMTNIQAAIGLAQLEKVNEYITRRLYHQELYNSLLKDVNEITLCNEKRPHVKSINWMYCILTRDYKERRELVKFLDKNGIQTRMFFIPMHQQPMFYEYKHYYVSEDISERGLYLPSGTGLSDKDIQFVCDKIKEFYNENKDN